ncbi:MAG TPA: flagellar basal body-associated FliL family protein [Acidimicrobiales bacterium]|nr:flagellar basal body-associated FliL family protein [Acidimicrobiales bacterium]
MSAVATDQATKPTSAGAESAASDGADGGEVKVKKSKKKLIIIMVVLLLVGFEAKSMLLKPHYKPGQAVPLGAILPLDQLTVNMSDGHLVQASISLQLTKVAAKTATLDVPRFDDAAITVLGAETYDALLAPGGRTEAKAAILSLDQKILPPVDGAAEQVSAVYFTSFVVQ